MQCRDFQLGTASLQLKQHREQVVLAEGGPPRSQRQHERVGRLQRTVLGQGHVFGDLHAAVRAQAHIAI